MGGLMALYALPDYNRFFSGGAALSPSLRAGEAHWEPEVRGCRLAAPTMGGLFRLAAGLAATGADAACRTVPGGKHSEAYREKRIPVLTHYLLAESTNQEES